MAGHLRGIADIVERLGQLASESGKSGGHESLAVISGSFADIQEVLEGAAATGDYAASYGPLAESFEAIAAAVKNLSRGGSEAE